MLRGTSSILAPVLSTPTTCSSGVVRGAVTTTCSTGVAGASSASAAPAQVRAATPAAPAIRTNRKHFMRLSPQTETEFRASVVGFFPGPRMNFR